MRCRTLLMGSCMASFSLVASAKEVTFFFDTHSSGPEIYPCDAGLVQRNRTPFCHFKGTSQWCSAEQMGQTPAAAGVGQLVTVAGEPVNGNDAKYACICTGTEGGAYLQNFIRYKASVWLPGAEVPENPNHVGWVGPFSGVLQGSSHGETVGRDVRIKNKLPPVHRARSVLQDLSTQVEQVTFNLGSELYGAHYFVDLCYRGPQLPFYLGPNHPENVLASVGTKAYITASNPFVSRPGVPTLDYVKLSGLAVGWKMVCDKQGVGNFKFDHDGETYTDPLAEFDSLRTDIVDAGEWSVPAGYEVSDGDSTHKMPPPAGTNWVGELTVPSEGSAAFSIGGVLSNADLLSRTEQWLLGGVNSLAAIVRNSHEVPRFCKMRYYFTEFPFADRERAWQRADARFTVKWAVEQTEEPGPVPTPNPTPNPTPTPKPTATPGDEGCTYTPGGWENRQRNRMVGLLPISLGSTKISSLTDALNALDQEMCPNLGKEHPLNRLFRHLLATELNLLTGATPTAQVTAARDAALLFLQTHNCQNPYGVDESWQTTFDSFNNGYTGPGHCD